MAPAKKSQSFRYFALVSAAVLCVSAFFSWGSVLTEKFTGMQGDGFVTSGLGLVAFLLLSHKKIPLWIPMILGLIAMGISIWDYTVLVPIMKDVNGSFGIGIYLAIISSFTLFLGSLIQWRKGKA